MVKRIHLFRAGKYGETKSRQWSNEEVKQLADNYDFNYRRAMVKIGHDGIFDSERPAVGWVKSLEYVEDEKGKGNLYGMVEFNDNEIENIKGKYINVSVEVVKQIEKYDLETDKKGAYLLGVALLGSSQPAVPSLEPVEFSKDKGEDVEVFSVVNFENEVFSKNENIDKIETDEIEKGVSMAQEIEKYQAKIKELEKVLQEYQAKERRQKVENFVNEYSKKVIPAVKDELVEFCLTLDESQLEAFKKILDKMPEAKIFEEVKGEEPKPDAQKVESAYELALKDLEIYKKIKGE